MKNSDLKTGDKFRVVSRDNGWHNFKIGEEVKFIREYGYCSNLLVFSRLSDGKTQYLSLKDIEPIELTGLEKAEAILKQGYFYRDNGSHLNTDRYEKRDNGNIYNGTIFFWYALFYWCLSIRRLPPNRPD